MFLFDKRRHRGSPLYKGVSEEDVTSDAVSHLHYQTHRSNHDSDTQISQISQIFVPHPSMAHGNHRKHIFLKAHGKRRKDQGSSIRLQTTIGLVFSSMVPQLSPKPKEEQRIVVSFVLSMSAILVTISDGIEAPPRFPNSSKL